MIDELYIPPIYIQVSNKNFERVQDIMRTNKMNEKETKLKKEAQERVTAFSAGLEELSAKYGVLINGIKEDKERFAYSLRVLEPK